MSAALSSPCCCIALYVYSTLAACWVLCKSMPLSFTIVLISPKYNASVFDSRCVISMPPPPPPDRQVEWGKEQQAGLPEPHKRLIIQVN
jgi:hypothetical protein